MRHPRKGTAREKADRESLRHLREDQSADHDKPPRIVAIWITPVSLRHVVGRLGDPRALNAHWFENKHAQRLVNLHVDRFFDQLTDEEVTDIRIRPAFSRAENKAIGLHSGEHLGDGPDRIACGDGRAVGRASLGVQSGSVLKELPDCVGTIPVEVVERQPPAVGESKHGRRKNRFRNAPPREQRI